MTRQRSCTSLWRLSPPELAEPSGYISGRFAIGTQVSSTEAMTEATTDKISDNTESNFERIREGEDKQKRKV